MAPRILEYLPDFKVGNISENDRIEEDEQKLTRKNKMIEKNNELKEEENILINKRKEEKKRMSCLKGLTVLTL